MSVNLSARQFLQPGLVKSVKKILDDVKIAPHQLRLEITETAVMNDTESALNSLNQLHQLGIELALDDFGIGHSSLSYLQKFPVSVLKIDKSFISKLDCSDKDFELVRIITLLGKSLGIRLVAEGVENRSQLEKLREMGCDCAQGYLFSRPQCTEKTEGLLRQIAKETNSSYSGIITAPIQDAVKNEAFLGLGVPNSGAI
jgi:Amt family ammonium transporter